MAGWRCLYAPAAIVYHDHGATTGHGSDLKYFHVGLTACGRWRRTRTAGCSGYGPAALGYDLAYVAYAALTDRTLAPPRGQDIAIRALAIMRERLPGAHLLVVGSPHPLPVDLAYAEELRELVEDLQLGHLRRRHAGRRRRLRRRGRRRQPGRMAEAFGRVAAEAMAASRPVGSTRVGGVPEVVEDGFNGLLVPADDAGALAEAVVRLRRDHDLAAALAANGRARVHARFDASRDLAAWTSTIAAVAPAYRDRATSIRAAAADDRGERLEEDRHVLSE